MESWGVNALVTSQLHLMANQTAMELQKTHSELFIFENKASSSCIYSALMSAWTCSESLMVCVLIIKRLIWYLFMFVFFWCWLFVVIVRVVSVAISGSLLTPCLLLTLSQLQIVLINKHPPDTNHSLGVNIIMAETDMSSPGRGKAAVSVTGLLLEHSWKILGIYKPNLVRQPRSPMLGEPKTGVESDSSLSLTIPRDHELLWEFPGLISLPSSISLSAAWSGWGHWSRWE